MAAKLFDLTPSEFFLWGWVKDFVFSVETTPLPRMKQQIKKAIQRLGTQIFEEFCKIINARSRCAAMLSSGHDHQVNV